jgi:NADPH-dependent ferric siderophore reductase
MMDDIINQSGPSLDGRELAMNAPETTIPLSQPERAPRVWRVRHELVRREVTVLRRETLSPHLLSLTFGGDSLAGFTSLSFDDHLKLILEGEGGQPVMRDYTPRRFDAERRELTVEFVLHDGGAASDWARRAQPGSRAVIGGPRGSMVIAPDHDWHLLAGDLSAMPAIHRRLEELPAGVRAEVLLWVPDLADRRVPSSAADVRIEWVDTADALLQAAARLRLPEGVGHAWAAGEAATLARLRQVLVTQHGLPREALRVSAYWKAGASGFHEAIEG